MGGGGGGGGHIKDNLKGKKGIKKEMCGGHNTIFVANRRVPKLFTVFLSTSHHQQGLAS